MKNYLFFNFKYLDNDSYSWDYIPEWFWQCILKNANKLNFSHISFEGVLAENDLEETLLENELILEGRGKYCAYHGNELFEVAKFLFDSSAIEKMRGIRLSDFNISNSELPFDEIVFFEGSECKMQIIPYDAMIILNNWNEDELLNLYGLDIRLPRVKTDL